MASAANNSPQPSRFLYAERMTSGEAPFEPLSNRCRHSLLVFPEVSGIGPEHDGSDYRPDEPIVGPIRILVAHKSSSRPHLNHDGPLGDSLEQDWYQGARP